MPNDPLQISNPLKDRIPMNLQSDAFQHVFPKFVANLIICLMLSSSVFAEQAKPNLKVGEKLVSTTTNAAVTETVKTERVLRHAVFFSFKESSTAKEVQDVVDAFAKLPGEIEAIIDFQAGTNNSPEGLDDGFTHCFLLTFKDEAGRAAYLPHPAHTGDFAKTLRPHLNDVFVIDYWGHEDSTDANRELKHAVFFKFKDDAAAEAVKRVEDAFAALPGKIDTITSFEWGRNNSPEKHDDGFTHCFMVTFDSDAGRKQYLPHPDHLGFVEVLKPVLDKVRVLDFWSDGYKAKK